MIVTRGKSRLPVGLAAGICAVLFSCGEAGPSPAVAGDASWVYRRSYFSHVLPPEVQAHYPAPESRSAYRLPLIDEAPGAGIRGVRRYNPIMIFDGRSTDVTIYREDWFQVRP